MDKDPAKGFRKRLRELRLAAKFTQEQLAEIAGMNYKHYQEIERGGKTEIRFSTIVRLAKAFKIPLYQLFTEDDLSPAVAETPSTSSGQALKKKSKVTYRSKSQSKAKGSKRRAAPR